ncbi:NmrA family protein [Pseudovirgaria hyperparasitica]|uniref:NmrA family protein n=1 Tax=Pseudovirgaria hyperparasitica TaxID=470096 RepID=A0A6A6VZD2_9PEZI|nr:NmrA family protein [Pseudovirgaria hyperparasitica]KAF2756012.1 NmrA family protein [Pseudovirgaria hyperparasitica]
MSPLPIIFVVGGTGAQGLPIVHALAHTNLYTLRVLTRTPTSPRAQSLLALPNTTLHEGTFTSETSLRSGMRGAHGAFINIDGFNVGEAGELYWGIRTWEIALAEGVKMFVWGNLEYVHAMSGFRAEIRSGHYDGKGRVGSWILTQRASAAVREKGMRAALFTTGPYMEMVIAAGTLMTPQVEDGVVTWRVPASMDGNGAVAHVALEDCGVYVCWLFANEERADGMDLGVAIGHLRYEDLAKGFETVTGHPAVYVETEFEEYWREGPMARATDLPTGYATSVDDPAVMTMRDNFTGFWRVWQASGGEHPLIKRDYALLDEIHPERIRTAEEWFRKEDEKGREDGKGSLWERVQKDSLRPLLKNTEDQRSGAVRPKK